MPVGRSNAPIATAIQSRCEGSQKSEEPHSPQKPRRICCEDWNHLSASVPDNDSADFGTSVEAKQCPDCFLHLLQWQMSGCGRSPSTVNVMAPHMHEPECINYGLSHVRSYGFQGRRTRTAIGSGGDCLLLDRRRSKAELQQTTQFRTMNSKYVVLNIRSQLATLAADCRVFCCDINTNDRMNRRYCKDASLAVNAKKPCLQKSH